jgi:DNA repair protein RadC
MNQVSIQLCTNPGKPGKCDGGMSARRVRLPSRLRIKNKTIMENIDLSDIQNVNEIDVVYKRKINCKLQERPCILTSSDTYDILMNYWDKNKIELLEEAKILFLNRANRVLHIMSLSQGGMCGTVMDPAIALGVALKIAAKSIILAHNHPSGSLRPSSQDEEITHKIKTAAKYFDIRVLDHLIVTLDGYFSFADEGMMYLTQ